MTFHSNHILKFIVLSNKNITGLNKNANVNITIK